MAPSYEHKQFSSESKRGTLRLLASPEGENGSLTLHQDVRIFGGRFHEAERMELELQQGRRAYIHVVRGSIAVNETRLNAGDGVKISPPANVVIQHGRDADIMMFEVLAAVPAPKRKSTRQT
jgi:redox-sensitive bicupin YhaK (pirin superfamily)